MTVAHPTGWVDQGDGTWLPPDGGVRIPFDQRSASVGTLDQAARGDHDHSGLLQVNVKDPRWGAKGDGITDDYAAILAAVIYAMANGYTVFFPVATRYRILTPLVIDGAGAGSPLSIFGYGKQTSAGQIAPVAWLEGPTSGPALTIKNHQNGHSITNMRCTSRGAYPGFQVSNSAGGIYSNISAGGSAGAAAGHLVEDSFWLEYHNRCSFTSPDTSTPSVLYRSMYTSGATIFSPGPTYLIKHHGTQLNIGGAKYLLAASTSATIGQMVFENVGLESANTPILDIVSTAAAGTQNFDEITMIQCDQFDSVAGGSKAILRAQSTNNGLNFRNVRIKECRDANSTQGTVECAGATPSNVRFRGAELGMGQLIKNTDTTEHQECSYYTPDASGALLGIGQGGAQDFIFQFRQPGDAQLRGYLRADGALVRGDGTVAPAVLDLIGTGSPETVVTAPVGSTFHRTNGGAGTSFYVKETGTGNTGWVGK